MPLAHARSYGPHLRYPPPLSGQTTIIKQPAVVPTSSFIADSQAAFVALASAGTLTARPIASAAAIRRLVHGRPVRGAATSARATLRRSPPPPRVPLGLSA